MKRFVTLALAAAFLAAPVALGSGAPASAAEQQQARKLVSGIVVDKDGQPVIGATVMVPGTTIGAITDANGRYNISIPSSAASIEISCIAFKSQTVAVPSSGSYQVTLADDAEMLEETVVVGYGVQKKSNLTGAIASVKATDLENRTATDLAQAIQGKAAGVQIINASPHLALLRQSRSVATLQIARHLL